MDMTVAGGLRRQVLRAACLLGVAVLGAGPAAAQERFIVMASTTSTEQSGLFGHLLPAFKAATGIELRVVAVGTGQALDMGRRGDADVVFVHDTAAEEKFVAEGFALKRLPVMYNDFVVVGPASDPAGARGNDIAAALKKLAAARAAPMPPNCACGRRPASTSAPPGLRATGNAAAAWGRRSTWRRRPRMPTR